MKKLVLASVSAFALLSVAACSDSTDTTTTQSVPDAPVVQPAPTQVDPAAPATPPAVDDSTTQSITPTPESGSGDDTTNGAPMDAAPVEPAPAQ